jgi:hypothetical protein
VLAAILPRPPRPVAPPAKPVTPPPPAAGAGLPGVGGLRHSPQAGRPGRRPTPALPRLLHSRSFYIFKGSFLRGSLAGAGGRWLRRAVGGSQAGGQGIPASKFTSVKSFNILQFTFVMLIHFCNRFAPRPRKVLRGSSPLPSNAVRHAWLATRARAVKVGLLVPAHPARQPCAAPRARLPRRQSRLHPRRRRRGRGCRAWGAYGTPRRRVGRRRAAGHQRAPTHPKSLLSCSSVSLSDTSG